MSKIVDFRSDTVTQPNAKMRELMAQAPVGDDVYGEDPTVNALQDYVAELTGHESALFVATGTQSNLIALLAHCQRGDEFICGQQAHTYKYEGGGAAVLGSIQPQPLEFEADGSLCLKRVASAIKADDAHFARTKLLALENTTGGKVLSQSYLKQARDFCRDKGLSFHLDGARACNAAVKQGIPLSEITSLFDSVSICLSKGLGAPVGSVLCGSRDFIAEAHRWRKVVGGGMRQAGILAAGARYAIEHQYERLSDDHANAQTLASALAQIDGLICDPQSVQTNIFYVDMQDSARHPQLRAEFNKQGILLDSHLPMRFVTHLDIDKEDVQRVIAAFKAALA